MTLFPAKYHGTDLTRMTPKWHLWSQMKTAVGKNDFYLIKLIRPNVQEYERKNKSF